MRHLAPFRRPARRRAARRALLVAALAAVPSAASAATIAVNSQSDDLTNNGNCTLREAIVAANTDAPRDGCTAGSPSPTRDVVSVPTGTYTLTVAGTGEDAGASGDLDVMGALDLEPASGIGSFVLDGAALDRVLHVLPGASVTIRDGTIRNGRVRAAPGGAIRNQGTLTLQRTTVTASRSQPEALAAGEGLGGCIHNGTGALLSVEDSVVTGCVAQAGIGQFLGRGGGIANEGALVAQRSALSGNTASGGSSVPAEPADGTDAAGGALWNAGEAQLLRCTVTENVAAGYLGSLGNSGGDATGGAVANEGTLLVEDSTLDGNQARGGDGFTPGTAVGGAIASSGDLTVRRATLSRNEADGGLSYGGPGGAATGGAIATSGTFAVENATFYANAALGGGVIANGPGGAATGGALALTAGSATIDSVTLAANQAVAGHGGNAIVVGFPGGDGGDAAGGTLARVGDAALALGNTIVTGGVVTGGLGGMGTPSGDAGSATGENCVGLDDHTTGGNVESPGDTCELFTGPLLGDQNNVSPEELALAELAANGGPTDTMALGEGSVAIGTARAVACPATDQRGYARVGTCDVGAFETDGVAAAPIFADGFESTDLGAWSASVPPPAR